MATNNIQGSPSFWRNCKYDVFISFRGPDTRNGFVDHLYNHLIRKGIFAFKDDERLEKGESIPSELKQAIKGSRISIVVFSKGYADSEWCLEEMAMIAECKKELKQKVFPVFYDVDPSDVRKQYGVYKNAFVSHTQKFIENQGKVDRWKSAMEEFANLGGWHISNSEESRVIAYIVQKVIKELDHKFSGIANDLIGIQSRVEGLEKLLKLSSADDDFRILGIWGMGGIGKTTLATVLYDKISYQFEACCFIENVDKMYKDGGAMAVQKQILRQTLDEKNLNTYSPSEISGILRNRLHNMKVLVVLDNVNHLEQLTELKIEPKLLRVGSRMIITTRDEHILKVYEADKVHNVPLMNDGDARELFCRKAFKSGYPEKRYEELIPQILKYAQCLPLAIGVLGSFFYQRPYTQWRAALYGLRDRLGEDVGNKIMDVLQWSYEDLGNISKEIFLHIACFFKGERMDYVSRILDCCSLTPGFGIPILVERSLITIKNQEIHMHEMLQELGKKIVQEQFPQKQGWWSRLWLYEDFCHVMKSQTGTNNVEAIVLDQKAYASKYLELDPGVFSKMKSLKLLILHKNFSGNLDFLSNSLHYLTWHGYPSDSLPPSFQPDRLVELNMPNSNIKRLWPGIQRLPSLRRMDLSNSKYLEETPNFEEIRNLERLDLTGCTNLLLVHSSIGLLRKLACLSLRNCSNLVGIDFGTKCMLRSLRVLQLSGCTKLESTPDITVAVSARMEALAALRMKIGRYIPTTAPLEYLDLEQCTNLSTVHESITYLKTLKYLSLRGCTNLDRMDLNVKNMTSLQTLDLRGCSKLSHLPPTMFSLKLESLIVLDLSCCNLIAIPDTIGELMNLERLNLKENKLLSLPDTIKNLSSLAYLNLAHCHELQLQYLPALPSLNPSSEGRYFKTESASRNNRSGLYIFDCPKCLSRDDQNQPWNLWALSWLLRLVEAPQHFQCGFDIVVPGSVIPEWFDYQFKGDSIIRMVDLNMDDSWIGFAFCAAFKANRHPSISGSSHDSSSSPLPHHFYLSFESEEAEETFNMPLQLDLDKIGSSEHLWLIYIARPHCHFVNSGAHITFKARPDLEITKWGLRMVFMRDVVDNMEESNSYQEAGLLMEPPTASLETGEGSQVCLLPFNYVHESRGSSGPKIQLPYNWLVTDEEERNMIDAKDKENNLSNVGFTSSHDEEDILSSSSH